MTLTRARALTSAAAGLALVASGLGATFVDIGPAGAASPQPSAVARQKAGPVGLPNNTPVRVQTNGGIPYQVDNKTEDDVRVTTSISLKTGNKTMDDAGTKTYTLLRRQSEVYGALFNKAGLARLKSATFGYATITVNANGQTQKQTLMVVAPSDVPRLDANKSNPLAGGEWGVYEGDLEAAWNPFVHAKGATQQRLAKIALEPKARWFTEIRGAAGITKAVKQYVEDSQKGNKDALVSLTMFMIRPWEHEACDGPPTAKEMKQNYKNIDAFARGIGSARAMVVVQPDGPFAGCTKDKKKRLSKTVAYAVNKLAALPRTSAYVDMGSADYNKGPKSVQLLIDGGIRKARGISLDVTHADSVEHQITFANHLVKALDKRGIHGKHVVIDTSDNGQPFNSRDWNQGKHPGHTSITQADVCKTNHGKLCLSLGIPPTTDVANKRWGLSANQRKLAAKLVDAYIWVKRPWLTPGNGYPFSVERAEDLGDTSPYWAG